MAEGNGELNDDVSSSKPEDRGDGERTEDYVKLLEYGLDRKVMNFQQLPQLNRILQYEIMYHKTVKTTEPY